MYLLGQFTNRGSVIKFQKKSMAVDWKVEIGYSSSSNTGSASMTAAYSEMNEIYSFVQPPSSDSIFGCGYKWINPDDEEESLASIFKLDEDGDLKFAYVFAN
mmetsp:Transcript_12357/g.19198  ORF Transcript_12357/g.19198 Transcript_12357/m.19198 type:complete len:102 (+) Transcript_12357:722-1027(+)